MLFEEGPLYYREIQKNAYLKRVPNETTGSKFMQLGYKKVPLKPMWTLFCIHNGRTPYLEQYVEATSPTTLSHKPVWNACLRTARHVTASVKPRAGGEYDFLIDTDQGPVRMIAPDWDTMQDWVSTLRNKLHELKILSSGENVYCAAPAAPVPRAPARDPTSPLPPTPPVPPDRVPGIELIPPRPPPEENQPQNPPSEPVDISNWEEDPQPSTSTDQPQSVAKICGQNICLDDSILRRRESAEDFFDDEEESEEFKQTVKIGEGSAEETVDSDPQPQTTNITVIQVSNKGPPHTAIPVMGPETDVFNFDFKDKVTIQPDNSFVNIVNTEDAQNGYGAVFNNDGDYGHLSMTTTVNLTDNGTENVNLTNKVSVKDDVEVTNNSQESVYERLCMASTSNETVARLRNMDKVRKSSLPNLDTTNDSTYEYLFPNNNGANTNREESLNNGRIPRNVEDNVSNSRNLTRNGEEIVSNSRNLTRNGEEIVSNNRNLTRNGEEIISNNRNLTRNGEETVSNNRNLTRNSEESVTNRNLSRNGEEHLNNGRILNGNRVEVSRPSNLVYNSSVDPIRVVRSNIERSHSQNAYDTSERLRERLIRPSRSPKRDGSKNDKSEPLPAKPIWKRGLTELSLLTKLRIGGKRHESPTRHETEIDTQRAVTSVTSPVKVVRRSRPEGRIDGARRRSSSLNNGQLPTSPVVTLAAGGLQPLRARQAAALAAEQRRGAAVAAPVSPRDPPGFVDYEQQVWICYWGNAGRGVNGRVGDRVAGVRRQAPRNAQHATQLLKQERTQRVDILFHRVPLGKIYVLNRRDNESLGIKLDGECNIVSVERQSIAARAGLPPPGKWAVTEVNNRPINLLKGGEEEMLRLSMHGSEVSVLIQPSALVKKIRAALKANKYLAAR